MARSVDPSANVARAPSLPCGLPARRENDAIRRGGAGECSAVDAAGGPFDANRMMGPDGRRRPVAAEPIGGLVRNPLSRSQLDSQFRPPAHLPSATDCASSLPTCLSGFHGQASGSPPLLHTLSVQFPCCW